MKIAVSNSSPLILLAKIQCLDLLMELFDIVYIPQAVYDEVVIKGKQNNQADAFIVEQLIEMKKIQIRKFDKNLVRIPNIAINTLHPGELEAISLALSIKEGIILLDDQEARNIARGLKLKVKGTLGILINLKERGNFTSAEAISHLELLNNLMYLSGDLYQFVLKTL